ncbi:MAG TPA: hypothetical protein VLC91_13660 [Spongiibacteraceae bacterium]|nr:hypothetical protein [Spongiibacteraceae bacterium]
MQRARSNAAPDAKLQTPHCGIRFSIDIGARRNSGPDSIRA